MKQEKMKEALEAAANYIDALGGDSKKYRQLLAQQSPQRSEDTKERSDWNEQENLYDLAVKADNGGQP